MSYLAPHRNKAVYVFVSMPKIDNSEEYLTSCSSIKVFLFNFYLTGRLFKTNSWLGKYEEHLIEIIELLSMKSKITLYSCWKLCLYSNQIIRFSHKLRFGMLYADMIIGKGVPFLLQAGLRMGTAQFASKKEHFFVKKKIFKKLHFFKIYTI